jgi:hypothetical protein
MARPHFIRRARDRKGRLSLGFIAAQRDPNCGRAMRAQRRREEPWVEFRRFAERNNRRPSTSVFWGRLKSLSAPHAEIDGLRADCRSDRNCSLRPRLVQHHRLLVISGHILSASRIADVLAKNRSCRHASDLPKQKEKAPATFWVNAWRLMARGPSGRATHWRVSTAPVQIHSQGAHGATSTTKWPRLTALIRSRTRRPQ